MLRLPRLYYEAFNPWGVVISIMVYMGRLTRRGTLFSLLIYEGVGISLIEVYEKVVKYRCHFGNKAQKG